VDDGVFPGAAKVLIGYCCADFRYCRRDGEIVVEDVKSEPTKTPLYRWKKKHVEAQYRITVREI
jgi:hypothetical protein